MLSAIKLQKIFDSSLTYSIWFLPLIIFFFLIFIYVSEREPRCASRGERQRVKESLADSPRSGEPEAELDLRTLRSWREPKSKVGPPRLSHPDAPSPLVVSLYYLKKGLNISPHLTHLQQFLVLLFDSLVWNLESELFLRMSCNLLIVRSLDLQNRKGEEILSMRDLFYMTVLLLKSCQVCFYAPSASSGNQLEYLLFWIADNGGRSEFRPPTVFNKPVLL